MSVSPLDRVLKLLPSLSPIEWREVLATAPSRDDIGAASYSELERLRTYVGQLEADKRRLELEARGVRRELAAALIAAPAAPAPAAAQPPNAPTNVASPSLTEEDVLKTLKSLAHSKRNHPVPKGMMIDSGNGPEPAGVPRLGTIREEWRENYQRAWDTLSRADQEILADFVSESGIGIGTAPAQPSAPADNDGIPPFLDRRAEAAR
jgi:hypothetical protein